MSVIHSTHRKERLVPISFCCWQMFHQKIEIPHYLFNNKERLNFSNASFIASKIPLGSCLLSNTRHSKKVNLGSMVSGSTKKYMQLLVHWCWCLYLHHIIWKWNSLVKFSCIYLFEKEFRWLWWNCYNYFHFHMDQIEIGFHDFFWIGCVLEVSKCLSFYF